MSNDFTFYNSYAPVLDRALRNLEHVLKKGEANAEERGIDPEIFLTARLAPDMHNLIGQVEVATSVAKASPYRLVGTEPPAFADMENNFASVYDRIAQTRAQIAKFSADEINPTISRAFSIQLGPNKREFIGQFYVHGFLLPNIYFHCTTAYNILRSNGVPIGKFDFFGGGGS